MHTRTRASSHVHGTCVHGTCAQVLSAFAYEPIKEDMSRRGWWDEDAPPTAGQQGRLAAFALLPLVGPASYLLLRPSLDLGDE